VQAVDISPGALSVASSQNFEEETARTGALKPDFIMADVLKGPQEGIFKNAQFDVIVSNPPYVMDSEKVLMRTNVLDHEPHLALFVPDNDALKFYTAVAEWARALLSDQGAGVVEINEALGRQTAKVFDDAGFRDVEVLQDLNSRDRFIRAIQ
jgi:release factor glutamine methyltransferase